MLAKLIFPDFTLTPSHLAGGVTYTQTVNAGDDLAPGCAAMAELTFAVLDGALPGSVTLAEGQTFSFQYTHGGAGGVYTDGGVFTITEIKRRDGKTTVRAGDNMRKTDTDVADWLRGVTYPITLYNLLLSFCAHCGIVLGSVSITNGSFLVRRVTDNTEVLGRKVLGWIAEIAASHAVIGVDGKLYLRSYAESDITLDNAKYVKYAKAGYRTDKIDRVQLRSAESGASAVVGAGDNTLAVTTNPLVSTKSSAEIQPAAQVIYDALADIDYIPFEMTLLGDQGVSAGDIITINGEKTLVMHKKMTASGVTLSATGGKRREVQQPSTDEEITRLQGRTDGLSRTLDETAGEVERIAEDYVSTSTVEAKIENYIDSESGTAKIIAACEGVYTTDNDIAGLVSETEVKAIIESQISESGGSIKLYVEGKNYITQTTADGVYTKKTELNAEISQYIDTTAGTAKIVAACAAVYQTQSGMSGYVTKTEMSTSITQEVNSKFATLKLETSASTSGGQTTSTLTLKSGSETLGSSAVIAATTAAQASTIAASAVNGITLTASTSVASNQTTTTLTLKNGTTTIDSSSVVGTTAAQAATISASAVNGITLSVTNAEKSSTLTLKNGTTTITSGTIQMTGIVTISDLAGTTTTINGANIKTGTISADRIDVSNLKVVTIWMDSKRVVYTSASSMYLGGDTSSGAVSDMYIRSLSRLILTNSWTSNALICNWATKTFEPGLTSNFSLGTSAKRWKMIYTEGLDAEGNIVPRSSSLYSLGTSALRFKETHTEKLLIGSTSNNTIEINTSRELRPGYTSASYPFYLGTSSYPWHYAYIGSVSALLGTGAASRLGFYGETPITRLTLSTSSNNQSYSSATASNYLYILNNIVGMLKKYGLISA